jgi:cytochrome b561
MTLDTHEIIVMSASLGAPIIILSIGPLRRMVWGVCGPLLRLITSTGSSTPFLGKLLQLVLFAIILGIISSGIYHMMDSKLELKSTSSQRQKTLGISDK